MDFFEAQDQARRSTKKLVFLFIVACVCVVLAINAVAVGVLVAINYGREPVDEYRDITRPAKAVYVDGEVQVEPRPPNVQRNYGWWRPEIFGLVSLGTLVVIGGGSLYKTAQLHGDGGKVARLLGGRLLDSQSTDQHEQKLLNIVEEMSIASGVPVPDVYVMDDQMGINAFAAGNDIESAVVGVTRGCMERLTRDELQGVVAHEFSHILNGDMKLNLRLIGVIFGLLVIGLIGYSLFRFAPYMNTRSRDDKGAGVGIMLLLIVAGILVWIIGSIGVFFGRLIQASVSRQREFLADASAVQFTRNPGGIRDALRRIGGHSFGSDVKALHAGEVSHMFFADGFSSLFATHPPLPKRIEALDPRWDGTFLSGDAATTQQVERPDRGKGRSRRQTGVASIPVLGDIFGGGQHTRSGNNLISNFLGAPAGGRIASDPTSTVAQRGGVSSDADEVREQPVDQRVGMLDAEHIEFAHQLASKIPQQLREAARHPVGARAILLSLFLSESGGTRAMQEEILAQRDQAASKNVDKCFAWLQKLGPAGRLPLMTLIAPVLRHLGDHQKPGDPTPQELLDTIRQLAEADDVVEPFEYALFKIASRLISKKQPKVKWAAVTQIEDAIQTLFSGLASAGARADDAKYAFQMGVKRAGAPHVAFKPQFTIEEFDRALDQVAEATPPVKRRIVIGATEVVSADRVVTVEEGELLRAIATVLQCPLPPFMEAVGGMPSS